MHGLLAPGRITVWWKQLAQESSLGNGGRKLRRRPAGRGVGQEAEEEARKPREEARKQRGRRTLSHAPSDPAHIIPAS